MTADVTVRYWAGARRAAGTAEEVTQATSIKELRDEFARRPELASLAAVVAFLVNNEKSDDNTALEPGAVVDVLPPFAGG
ncbi:molybdopterin converting factor small subunit [Jatrophihabitans sp. GAS493]|uniref:MoaD/ThiS family protein n=1 Tax=Jatrophihabitans sp. GAS493 TaxID=1907575 RepID=UPI000BB93D8E|nr:molybdopterin converting factor small subunit [Jatrophihabitans sp. GAS493]